MKMVILRSQKRTKSISSSDAEPWCYLLICLVSNNETEKTNNCPVTINYVNKYVIVLQSM
jgi:hypothetical protein